MLWKWMMFLFAGLLYSESALAEIPLKVMSFNVRYGTALDGPNAWPLRRDLLVETIRKYDPDILGTQETLEFQAEYMAENLSGYRWIGVGRDADGGGEFTAILYKHKVLLPIESGNYWLSEDPGMPGSVSWDSSLTRMVTWIKFRHRETGTFFHYANTHFDHRGEEARQQSARLMLERIAALPQDLPVIVTGDFNAHAERSEPYRIFIEGGMSDAWTTAEHREGPVTTWSAFKAPDPDSKQRIDWILYRGPFSVEHCETVTYNDEGRYPSDHYPVFARMTLKP